MSSSDPFRVRTHVARHRRLAAKLWPAALVWLWLFVTPGPAFSASAEPKERSAAPPAAKPQNDPAAEKAAAEKAKKRAEAVSRLASRLGVGQGGVVADIGAGSGVDTWVFATIVGTTGTVYAEEITESLVKSLRAEAEKRKLPQVRPVHRRRTVLPAVGCRPGRRKTPRRGPQSRRPVRCLMGTAERGPGTPR